MWGKINLLRVYAMIFLIAYDRHYYFSLCYKTGAGIHTKHAPFYINSTCLCIAFFTIIATYAVLFFITTVGRYFYSLMFGKKEPSLVVDVIIVLLTMWLLGSVKLFSISS